METASSLNNAAVRLYEAGKVDQAIDALSEALEKDPVHPEATYNLATAFWERGAIADIDAVDRLRKITLTCPGWWRSHYLLGLAHIARRDSEAAIVALTEAMRLAPEPERAQVRGAIDQVEREKSGWTQLIRTIRAHPKGIMSLAFAPDETRILIGGASESGASLWDISTGQCLRSFGVVTGVWAMQFMPDGQRALIPSSDECRLWDLADGTCRQTLKWKEKLFSFGIRVGGWYSSVNLHPDGQRVLTFTSDREVTSWDLQTGKGTRILESEGRPLCDHAAISADGVFAVMVGVNLTGVAMLLNLSTGRITGVPVHTCGITSVAAGKAGVLTGSYDGTACLWEPVTGRILRTFKHSQPHTEPAVFFQAGRYALTENHSDGAQIWDVTSGKIVRTLEQGDHYDPLAFFIDRNDRVRTEHEVSGGQLYPKASDNAVMSVALSPDGRLAATGTYEGRTYLWDIATGRCLRTFDGFPKAVQSICFSPGGRYLIAASNGEQYEDKGVVRIWSVKGIAPVRFEPVLAGQGSCSNGTGPSGVGITSVANSVLAQSVEDSVRRKKWDEARRLLRQACVLPGYDHNPQVIQAFSRSDYYSWHASFPYARVLHGHGATINSVSVSPDGKKALTASDDGTARLWDLGGMRQEMILDGHGAALRSASFTSDGRRALAVGSDSKARIYDLSRGEIVSIVGVSDGPVDLAAVSRKQQHLLSAGRGEIVLRDLRTGQRVAGFSYREEMAALSFSENGVLFATYAGGIYRWNPGRGDPVLRLHVGPVKDVSVFLASYMDKFQEVALVCTPDGTARLWDLENLVSLGVDRDHGGNVLSVTACCPGEGGWAKSVITACDDGNAYLWSFERGKCERRVPNPGRSAKTVAYTSKLKCMLTVSKDNEVVVWTASR